jgi:hypothetical protein
MKYKGMNIYKNTDHGDVIASTYEARKAIRLGHLIQIGYKTNSYWVIQI